MSRRPHTGKKQLTIISDSLKEHKAMSHENSNKKEKKYSFFSHKECEYFPCHKTNDPENFNCLFCYCPLYALGDRCGGNFRYTEKGVKDCTNCLLPHKRENYGYVTGKYQEIKELALRERNSRSRDGEKEK